MKRFVMCAAAVAAVASLPVASAGAESVADFYKSKTVTVLIGNAPGGGYDRYARTLAAHIGSHIPGKPNVIAQNMPGAGGLKLTRHMYTVAPKDGSAIASAHRGIPIYPLLGEADGFDPSKFGWIGNLNKETAVCLSWGTSGVDNFADVLKGKQLIVGTTGKGANLSSFEQPLINVLGAKLKVIRGYEGGEMLDLAMQRGEIQGRCGMSWSSVKLRHADWLKENKVNVLVQLGFERHPDIPDVPLVQEFAQDQDDKRILNLLLAPQNIGRPYFTSPGVPEDRLAALRAAFDGMVKDPTFLAAAKKQRMELDTVSGEALQKMLAEIYETPDALVKRARAAVQ